MTVRLKGLDEQFYISEMLKKNPLERLNGDKSPLKQIISSFRVRKSLELKPHCLKFIHP
jgi:hypothetical protein